MTEARPPLASTPVDAGSFAADWIAAWNAADLEAVLSHYAEDCRFSTPMAKEVMGTTEVEGKAALRRYWGEGLRRVTLRFTLRNVLQDPASRLVAILYDAEIGERRLRACEVFTFDLTGLVKSSAAHYGAPVEALST